MTELFKTLAKLPLHKSIVIVLFCLSFILPSALFILYFMPGFFEIDSIKLIITAAAYAFPFHLVLWFTFLGFCAEETDKGLAVTEQTILGATFLSSLFVSLEFGIMTLFKFFGGEHVDIETAIIVVMIFNVLLIILAIRDYNGRKAKLKSKAQ